MNTNFSEPVCNTQPTLRASVFTKMPDELNYFLCRSNTKIFPSRWESVGNRLTSGKCSVTQALTMQSPRQESVTLKNSMQNIRPSMQS